MYYLFSSATKLPDLYFQGYGFYNSSFIYDDGVKDFYNDFGHSIPPGEDGCYVTVEKNEANYTIGVDHAGYKKLFYYYQDDFWCVSNSIVKLAEHLKENHIDLSLNWAQVFAFNQSDTLCTQISCFSSCFNEIKMLPSSSYIEIDSSGKLKIKSIPAFGGNISYRDALSEFIKVWCARFRMLSKSQSLSITSDITGGKDSRTLLSMLKYAYPHDMSGSNINFKTSKAEHWKKDFIVASHLSSKYCFDLNKKKDNSLKFLSSEESYSAWRTLNLMIYSSVYFPSVVSDPFNIHIHGGGGENYRPFYNPSNPESYIDSKVKFSPSYLYEDFKKQFLDSLSFLRKERLNVPEMVLQYREFRNRMHAGRSPQYSTTLTPLGSKYLSPLYNFPEKVKSGQVFIDVIESLCPGLAFEAYDSPEKSPTKENIDSVIYLDGFDNLEDNFGKIYISNILTETDLLNKPPHYSDKIKLLSEEFYESLDVVKCLDIFSQKFMNDATVTMSQALTDGKFPHASAGKSIAKIISTAFAVKIAT